MNRGQEWGDSVAKIIQLGKFLHLKHREMTPKEFNEFGRTNYGVGRSTLGKIMKIAEHRILSDPQYSDLLPPAWGLLYELRGIDDDKLLEKLKNGGLKNINKYELWDLRGVKILDRSKANKVQLPTDQRLTDYVRSGMVLETRDGLEMTNAAKTLRLQPDTYRRVRAMIMLSERPELSPQDRKFVIDLLEKIDKTRNVRPYHQKAMPLIERFWGKQRNKDVNDRGVQRRIDAFRSTIIILNNTCEKLDELEVPYMSDEDVNQSINELAEAGRLIRKLAETLRRSKHG